MDIPALLRRAELRVAGYSDDELRRLRRTGVLTLLCRDAYLRGALPSDPQVRHALAARAAIDRLADDAVCSHATAAVLHGIPLWQIPLDRVQVTRAASGARSRSNARVRVHVAPLDSADIELVSGMPVTSIARTVADLGRTVPFAEAVVVADAALHGNDAQPGRRAPVSPQHLAAALAFAGRWPGVAAARRAIAFADGRSASVGESLSRVALHRAGLPTPVLQWPVPDHDGRLIGLADFGWPQLRTVGEFDGKVKYGRLLRAGQEPGDVVFAEKLREDRIRDRGLAVVRWTWRDLTDFDPVADRLRRHFRP